MTYDLAGNLATLLDNTGTTTYAYDALNRPTGKTWPGGTVTAAAGWNEVDKLISASADASGVTNYGYDPASRLAWVSDPGGSCTTSPYSRCTQLRYNQSNQRQFTFYGLNVAAPVIPAGQTGAGGYDTRWNSPSGPYINGSSTMVFTNYVPAASGRPTDVASYNRVSGVDTTLARNQYTYTKAGSTTQDSDLIRTRTDPTTTTTYTYDTLDRLTLADAATGTDYGFAYDNAGNLTSTSINGTPTSQHSDPQNRLCTLTATTCPGTAVFTYNAKGDQLSGNGHTFAVNNKSQVATIDGVTKTYSGPGNKDLVTSTSGGTTTTHRSWVTGVIEDTTGVAATNVTYVRTPDGELISRRVGPSTNLPAYYLLDGQQNVTRLVTAAGVDQGGYSYQPYGKTTATNTTGFTTATDNVYRYKSGWYQNSTGGNGDLYKFGARYYDTGQAKWTQPDPSGSELNAYAFVAGDPINSSDASGLKHRGILSKLKYLGEDTFTGGTIGGTSAAITGCIVGTFATGGVGCQDGAAAIGFSGLFIGATIGFSYAGARLISEGADRD